MSTETTRRLTFERIATTEDTSDPVIRAEFPDVDSRMDVIVPNGEDDDRIHVWFVTSEVRGDMKRMLDEVCRQLDRRTVVFLSPLSFSDFEDRLHDFERVTVDTPDGKQERLVCEWGRS